MNRMDEDKVEEAKEVNGVVIEKTETVDNVSPCAKTDKINEPKIANLSNTDSEDTLSNVESVPNSPARDTRQNIVGKNAKYSNRVLKHKISTGFNLGVTRNNSHHVLRSTSKRKSSEMKPNNGYLNFAKRTDESGLRYYLAASENRDLYSFSDANNKNAESENIGGSQESTWLRYYERPHKAHVENVTNVGEQSNDSGKENQLSFHQQRKYSEANKNTCTSSSGTENFTIAKERMFNNSSKKFLQPIINPPNKKRGRPRKQINEDFEINSKRRRESPAATKQRKNGPLINEKSLNGSRLTKLESDILFFKFSQHGNFKYTSEQPPIIIYNKDLYQKISARMECYDPRKYYVQHNNGVDTEINSDDKTAHSFRQQNISYNDCSKFYPSDNSGDQEFGHKLRKINPNSHTFTNEYFGDENHSKTTLSPSNLKTNIPSNGNSFNDSSNYMQSGFDATYNYHQNFYNNNVNSIGNDSYFNNYSTIANANNSINNINVGNTNNTNNDLNFVLNNPTEYENLTPRREPNVTMNNGNNMSSNSINNVKKSPTNDFNQDWNLNNVNQPMNSVNGIVTDMNSMNPGSEINQSINAISDSNNIMNSSTSAVNAPNYWMNRIDNMMNSRFSVIPPWHGSLLMYNSYLNNENSHQNNRFNSYTTSTEFDTPNYPYSNINEKEVTEVDNTNSWSQNILPNFDGQANSFDTTNSEFSNLNSGSAQENNNISQGVNLSLSNNPVSDANLLQTNTMEVGNANQGVGIESGLNSNIERADGTDNFLQMKTTADNNTERGVRGYDTNNLEKQAEEILPEIQEYVNQRLDSFVDCFNQNYKQTGLTNSGDVQGLTHNRETEITKLRQELADFTRQYSDEHTTVPQIPQEGKIE